MLPLPLLIWFSPAFPVGAFAYSHGLEWAQEAGDLIDAAGLEAWLRDLLDHGAVRSDAVLMALAHRASAAGDEAEIADLAELGRALATSTERRLETVSQGDAFALAIAKAWPCGGVDRLRQNAPDGVPLPVAVGVAAAGHDLDLAATLEAFVLGCVANLVSAAVRLGIVGQTDGQRVTAALLERVRSVALYAQTAGHEDLGGCAFRSDLSAIQHETLYSRLFRS